MQKLNHEPTYQEIADAMELDVADVILAFEANQFIYSLDETIYENDGSPILLEDKVSNKKEEDVVMKVSPVSYTHLDVYKRQRKDRT